MSSLLDNIILAKTDFNPIELTGGSIQVSNSKYTLQSTCKIVLFFGFSQSRNSISRTIKIKNSDANVLLKEIMARAKMNLELLKETSEDVLDLDLFKKNNTFVTNASRGLLEVGDRVDSDSNILHQDAANENFEVLWTLHSDYLKTIKTANGNSRRNSNKSKTKDRYITLLKKYTHSTIMVYVRSSTLKFGTPELYNLFGKSLDSDLLIAIEKQEVQVKDEVLNSTDKEFNSFMDAIGDII